MNYPTDRLESVADVIRGVSFDSQSSFSEDTEGRIAILRAGNIQQDLITDNDLIFIDRSRVSLRQLIKKNDIAMCMSSGSSSIVGKTAFAFEDQRCSVGAFCGIIRPKSSISPRFLFHFLNSDIFKRWTQLSQGVNIKNIKQSELKNFLIPIPSLGEQRRIASILDKADAIHRKRQKTLKLTDALVKSQFSEMFGDPVTNPKGWKSSNFQNIIIGSPQNGLYVPASQYGHGTRILRIDSFYNGKVNDVKALKRIDIDEPVVSRYKLHEDEVVINRVNSRKFLGKSALIPKHEGDIVFESNMMRIELDKKQVSPGFLIFFLQSDFIKSQILTACKDAVNQSSINQSDINCFKIFLPPLPLQNQFAAFVGQADKSKFAMQRQLEEAEASKSALIQQFFN